MKNIAITLEEEVADWSRVAAAKNRTGVSRWIGEYFADTKIYVTVTQKLKKISATIVFAAIVSMFATGTNAAFAYDQASRISDREIVERLTRLEEGQKAIIRETDKRLEPIDKRLDSIDRRFDSIDKRFDSIDRRFDSIDKRFDSIDRRFDSIDRRFEQFHNLVIGILASFAAIVAVTIGFAVWDRRTTVKPVENRINLVVEDLAGHKKKLSNLLEALKQQAETDKNLAAVLRSYSIL